jgi:acetolactate synthase-1/3 small subunit
MLGFGRSDSLIVSVPRLNLPVHGYSDNRPGILSHFLGLRYVNLLHTEQFNRLHRDFLIVMASRRAMLPLRNLLSRQCGGSLRQQQRASSSSSTQALAYKALHRRIAPLPTEDRPPAWSAPAAVSNILYETPLPSQAPPKSHILNCLVQNEPGVLSRVSGILAARGFNIDSLVVCNTEVDDLSRMTIVLQGQDGVVEQARRQLEDLVPVWAVLDYTQSPLVQRELLLAKVSILGPEYFEELLAHHREMAQAPETEETYEPDLTDDERNAMAQEAARESLRKDYHPTNLAVSQALRHKHEHLRAITFMTHQFGGKVLDISTNNCIVEVSAKPTRIDSFMKLIAPFGILESARTGKHCQIFQHRRFANQVQASWLYRAPRYITVLMLRKWRRRTL